MSDRIPFLFLQGGLLAVPFAVLIYGLACGGGIVGAVLSTTPAQILGGASYSLYLLHLPLGIYLTMAGKRFGLLWLHGWVGIGLYLGVAIGLALAVFVLVEEPARRWLRAGFARRIRQSPQSPVTHPAVAYAVALARSTSLREVLAQRYGRAPGQ